MKNALLLLLGVQREKTRWLILRLEMAYHNLYSVVFNQLQFGQKKPK